METLSKNFRFLYEKLKREDIDEKTFLNSFTSILLILSVENESDLNANDLRDELLNASRMIRYLVKSLDVLNYFNFTKILS